MKLISIQPSTKADKKMMALFDNEGRAKTIHFGSKGADDFTITKDKAQRERYIARHRANEDWTKPDTAGSLARWILWNTPSLHENIKLFKQRFNV